MAVIRVSNRALGTALFKAGFLPENCRLMDIVIGVEGAVILKFETMLTVEQLAKLGRVFADVAKEQGALEFQRFLATSHESTKRGESNSPGG